MSDFWRLKYRLIWFFWVNFDCWYAQYREVWLTKKIKIDYEWFRSRKYKNIILLRARLAGPVLFDDGSYRDRDGHHEVESVNNG
jgi:hypothetical protein